jgi:hypothetical protein
MSVARQRLGHGVSRHVLYRRSGRNDATVDRTERQTLRLLEITFTFRAGFSVDDVDALLLQDGGRRTFRFTVTTTGAKVGKDLQSHFNFLSQIGDLFGMSTRDSRP